MFYHKVEGKLLGLIVTHIDDFLYAGTNIFLSTVVQKLCKRFQVGRSEEVEFHYVGYRIKQDATGIQLDQCEYVDNIIVQPLSVDRERQKDERLSPEETTTYRSLVGSLNWIVQGSRPDLAFCLVELSTKFQSGTVADLQLLRKVIQKAKMSKTEIKYPVLQSPVNTWSLVVYSDASHANLCDATGSCGGHVVFLTDRKRSCCPIVWKSNKIDRVVRSTIAAETLAAIEGIEDAIYVKQMLIHILSVQQHDLPIIVNIDHKGAVEAIHSTRLVKDRRLRIDVAAIKECLEKGMVSEINSCSTGDQLADCLTKKGSNGDKLRAVLLDGILPSHM
jgi:hypothetical protein